MKGTAIILLILALGLIITACSKAPAAPGQGNTNSQATVAADDSGIDQAGSSPDIGALDDTQVSDSLPQ